MQRAHSVSTRVLATLLIVLGAVMVASTLLRGGGPVSLGIVVGVPLALLGAGRLYLARPERASRAGS